MKPALLFISAVFVSAALLGLFLLYSPSECAGDCGDQSLPASHGTIDEFHTWIDGSFTLGGRAIVIDGDSIQFGDTIVRIYGIDAPEADQSCTRNGELWPCGVEAAKALKNLIGNRKLLCKQQDTDNYDRVVAICYVDGRDLGAGMVSRGLAMAYRHFTLRYVNQELDARTRKAGMWDGRFIAPWRWRIQYKKRPKRKSECAIKGNINRHGERIYHTRSSRHYPNVRIDESRGERWFCSEEVAKAAGWRPRRGK